MILYEANNEDVQDFCKQAIFLSVFVATKYLNDFRLFKVSKMKSFHLVGGRIRKDRIVLILQLSTLSVILSSLVRRRREKREVSVVFHVLFTSPSLA